MQRSHTDALSHLYDTRNDTAYVATQANDQKLSRRTSAQRPMVVEDVTKAEAQNSETSHNTQPKSPTTAVQDQKLKQTEQTLQKSQARLEKAQVQLETTREQWIRQQVVVMAHDLNHQPLLNYLAGKGAQYINERDRQGDTALHHATNLNALDIVQWLLDHGADIETKDADGWTPLHLAVAEGYVDIVKILIKRGADIEAKERRVCATPLHMAGLFGHQAAVELLLDHGANITAQNLVGETPLDIAVAKGHEEVATLLRAAQMPGWKPQSHASVVPSVVVEDVTDSASKKDANDAIAENEAGNDAQRVTPATQPSVGTTPPTNVKDAPALARAKAAHKTAREAYEAAQKNLENAKRECQEAQDVVAQAKTASVHSKTIQQHVTHAGSTKTKNTKHVQITEQTLTPTTSTSSSLRANVKDAPDLAQAKTLYQRIKQKIQATEGALQKAKMALEHAKRHSQASLFYLQTTQQLASRLMDSSTTASCSIAAHLQPTLKNVRDYLVAP